MNLWVENVTASGVILTDLLIKEKAKFFANAFNIQENELVSLMVGYINLKNVTIFISIRCMESQEVHH
jgi:hypothetical protein